MKKIVLYLIFVFCLLFSGCQAISDYAESEIDLRYNALIEYFNEIALYSNNKNADGIVKRWEEPIRIMLLGDYTDEDYQMVTTVINDLNDLEVLPEIRIVEGIVNLYMYFEPMDEMADKIPSYEEGSLGTTIIYWNHKFEINKAYVGIVSDLTTQKMRNYLILKYIIHSLGIIHSSDMDPDSILRSEWADTQSPSEMDYLIIKTLYYPELLTGMNQTEAEETLRPWLKSYTLLNMDFTLQFDHNPPVSIQNIEAEPV